MLILASRRHGTHVWAVIIGGTCRKYHFCRDKSFVATNTCFVADKSMLADKHVFVATKVSLSQQTFCRDKIMFVATNICRDKTFVTIKIILVVAPANDRL